MMRIAVYLSILLMIGTVSFGQQSLSMPSSAGMSLLSLDEKITMAYRILNQKGNYEQKKNVLGIFDENYNNERVISIIIDLLNYTYRDERFREDDQTLYYDDVIAEKLVKILGKSGRRTSFPSLLTIVLDSNIHRDSTVKEAWIAIGKIKW